MMQRAIVKAHYTTPQSLKNHLAYIQREGVGIDGKKPELFTDEGGNLQTQGIEGEQRFFRLVLSPEHGRRIEERHGMRHFAKDFVKELERGLIATSSGAQRSIATQPTHMLTL